MLHSCQLHILAHWMCLNLISNIQIVTDPALQDLCGDRGMLPIWYELNVVAEVP